jgi:hypothetical protein
MPEEFVPQPHIAMSALYQTGHIAHGQAEEIGVFHDPNLWMQSCKGIRSDLGPGM